MCGFERIHSTEHVELEVGFPRCRVAALRHRTSVRDEHVDAAEFVPGFRDPGLQRGTVGDVDRGAGRLDALVFERGHRVFHLICIARADRDVRAFGGEGIRDGASDAARPAQYDGAFALSG